MDVRYPLRSYPHTHVDRRSTVDARRTTSSGALEPLARVVYRIPARNRPDPVYIVPAPRYRLSEFPRAGSERTGGARRVHSTRTRRTRVRRRRCQPSMPARQDRSDLVDDLATRGTITLHGYITCNNRTDTRPPWAVHEPRHALHGHTLCYQYANTGSKPLVLVQLGGAQCEHLSMSVRSPHIISPLNAVRPPRPTRSRGYGILGGPLHGILTPNGYPDS